MRLKLIVEITQQADRLIDGMLVFDVTLSYRLWRDGQFCYGGGIQLSLRREPPTFGSKTCISRQLKLGSNAPSICGVLNLNIGVNKLVIQKMNHLYHLAIKATSIGLHEVTKATPIEATRFNRDMILDYYMDFFLNENYGRVSFICYYLTMFDMNKRRILVCVNKTSTQRHKLNLEFDKGLKQKTCRSLCIMTNSKFIRF